MATRPSEPLWIGRRRGTNLSSLVAFPEPEPEPQGPFLGRLWDRLFNTVDGTTAAVIGFLTTMNAFTGMMVAAANVSPVAGVAAIVAAVLWALACARAGYLVKTRGEDAPEWARSLVGFLKVVGKVTVVMIIIISVLMLLYMVLAIVVAGRER